MGRSLRGKLMASFMVVIAISSVVTVWVGVDLIGDEIIRQAQDKVRIDLNSAREIYLQRLNRISEIVRLTSVRFFLREGFLAGSREQIKDELMRIREAEGLDILTITDKDGLVVLRARNPEVHGDSRIDDEIVAMTLRTGELVAGTRIVSRDDLAREAADLAEQARIDHVPTPMAKQRPEAEETSGMMIKAAAPIFASDGELIGVLYGGVLLNRNYEIVDTVKDIVYQGETYKGKDTGTVTIFQGDLRISTNVLGSDGTRAIGTRVSAAVYDQVIGKGIPWIARAFVVNDWYITAYEPLRDLNGEIIGMLYVGMLEAPYVDLRNRVVLTFCVIAVATLIILSVVMYFTTSSITKPLRKLVRATEEIARGYLAYRVQAVSDDELGQLAGSFNAMTAKLQKSADDYHALTQTLEHKVKERTRQLKETQDQLIQSEKLTSLGKMAAGIAHEINNPLTSVLINGHLLAESLKDKTEFSENLKLIIDETTRCSEIVKGLLEFSRQTPSRKEPADINRVIEGTLSLMKSHVLASRAEIRRDLGENLPTMIMDMNKMKQVFTNIIINALEAMPEGGTLTIRSRVSRDRRTVDIQFKDTGCGIPQDMMGRIFDPFFSTKETKGTGLGLSVSYGIVESHNGKIDVESEVGKGTTVTVRLPVGVPAIS